MADGSSVYIYDRSLTEISVMTSFYALNLGDNILIFAVLKQRLLQRTETEVSFCLIAFYKTGYLLTIADFTDCA